jgi:hypothetical protein
MRCSRFAPRRQLPLAWFCRARVLPLESSVPCSVTRLASISRSVVSPVTIPAFLRLILTAGLRFRIELFGSVFWACLFSLLVDVRPVEATFWRITIPTASSIFAFQFKQAAFNEAAAMRSEEKSRCLARFSRLSAENRRKRDSKHNLCVVFDLCLWLNDLCPVLFLSCRIKGLSFSSFHCALILVS